MVLKKTAYKIINLLLTYTKKQKVTMYILDSILFFFGNKKRNSGIREKSKKSRRARHEADVAVGAF